MSPKAIRLSFWFAPVFATAFAAAALAAAPATAQTEGPTLRVKVADLQTPAGRAVVRHRLEIAAEGWCRANPGAVSTVFACRRTLIAQLEQKLAARTGVAVNDAGYARLAGE